MFDRRRSTKDFAEEIKAHLDLEADELKTEGFSDEEAHRKSRLEFGNVQTAQERFYLKDRLAWLDNLAADLKFAARQLVKNPAFAATAILVLGLGMGASVAIFAFVNAALLEPLPYKDPGRLISVNESSRDSGKWPLSYPDYLDWQHLNQSFSSFDAYSGAGYLLHTSSGTEQVQAERVSGGFFKTLGVRPAFGRDFYPGENRPDGANVALLSYRAWVRRFGAQGDAIGRTVDLDGKAFTIIGVLPRAFSFAPSSNAEFWVPINTFSPHERMRNFYNFVGVARLRDGVTIQAARAEMTAIAKQLQLQYSAHGRSLGADVVPLSEVIIGEVRPILLTLLGGVSLLLVIAFVNVASLVLAKSESRRRETAVRSALGATRLRLMHQFVTEGLTLAGLGSLTGLIVASFAMKFLSRLVPRDMSVNMPFLEGVSLNGHTIVFAAAVALIAALILSATPILGLSSLNRLGEAIGEGSRGSAGRFWGRLGANLVVIELVIAVVLLAGAGLLGESLYRLLHVHLGFDPTNLATLQVMAPGNVYQSNQAIDRLYRQVVQRVSTLPGVESAGITSLLPVQCDCDTDLIQIEGRPFYRENNEVDERHVSPAYLPTLKATLVRGRFFTEEDDLSRPGVAVINLAMAKKYFGNESPIGQRILNEERGRSSAWEIVGVVDDIREGPLDANISPAEYFPTDQTPDRGFTLVVRTNQDAAGVLPALVMAIHQIGPDLGVSDESTLDAKINVTQAALLHRFSAWLVGTFAAIALVLGVVGLYGVVSYSVSQRTREIGVRMALGAQRSSVYSLVMLQAGKLAAAGLSIGLVCSVAVSLSIRSLLFGVEAWDAATLVCVVTVLGIASMFASFLPARRAASVNPVEALRVD